MCNICNTELWKGKCLGGHMRKYHTAKIHDFLGSCESTITCSDVHSEQDLKMANKSNCYDKTEKVFAGAFCLRGSRWILNRDLLAPLGFLCTYVIDLYICLVCLDYS